MSEPPLYVAATGVDGRIRLQVSPMPPEVIGEQH
jgi:hypothetical protein